MKEVKRFFPEAAIMFGELLAALGFGELRGGSGGCGSGGRGGWLRGLLLVENCCVGGLTLLFSTQSSSQASGTLDLVLIARGG